MKRNLALLLVGFFILVVVIEVWTSPAANAQEKLKDKVPKAGAIVDGPLPGMKFAYIPPGSFLMGSSANEVFRYPNETQHHVTLTRGFYLMTTEVTQAHWYEVMRSNQARHMSCDAKCPMEWVSWNDVQEFIRRLNQREESGKYRLPTEAEWEYAARAGTRTAIANGGISYAGCGPDANLTVMGWYCANSNKTPHPVGMKKPNGWGLYDMHGNVEEWCQDWYGDYPAGAVTDPVGPPSGPGRVTRGGSWYSLPDGCRSAKRDFHKPDTLGRIIGFRLVGQF